MTAADTPMVQLDSAVLAVSGDGVPDFFWPVDRAGVAAMRDSLVEGLAAAARSLTATDPLVGELVSCLLIPVWFEGMCLHQAEALVAGLRTAGRQPAFTPHHRLAGALWDARVPEMSGDLDLLRQSPPADAVWKMPLRMARDIVKPRPDGIRTTGHPVIDFRRGIVTLNTAPLISRHARMVGDPVTYRPVGHWFKPIDDTALAAAGRQVAGFDIPGLLLDLIRRAFAASGTAMSAACEIYLGRFLPLATAVHWCHLRRLEARRDLPMRLWSTAATNPRNRMLRHVVRRLGGNVTGHDHLPGTGMSQSVQKTPVDFECCDIFVTFTTGGAEGYMRNTFRPDLLVQPKPPVVRGIGDGRGQPAAAPALPKDRPLRVMCVSADYFCERVGGFPPLANVVASDWHARLLGQLAGMGYEVSYKPHPGNEVPHPAFDRFLPVKVLEGTFDKVIDDADVFVFDWARTTTLIQALLRAKPVLLCDFGIEHFAPDARALMERRFPIVAGRMDETNRAQVEWSELKQAIDTAHLRTDPTYVNTYFQGGDIRF